MTSEAPARRASRAWVLAPLGLTLALAVALAAGWIVERRKVLDALDAAPAWARAQGAQLSWRSRSIGGFPFRLHVELRDVRLAGAWGWAASAPSMVLQAYVFAPRHWVAVAPAGLTIGRPQGEAVQLRGQAVRASVTDIGGPAWRAAFEALSPAFVSTEAPLFTLQSAQRLTLEARPAPEGGADWLAGIERGVARPESALWHAASGSPFDLVATGRWRADALLVDRLEARAGPLAIGGSGGVFRPDGDGRLAGALPLRVRLAPQARPPAPGTPAAVLLAQAKPPGGEVPLDLVLSQGTGRLGRFRLGPSPARAP